MTDRLPAYPGDDVAREAWDASKLTPLPWAAVGPCECQPFPYALAREMVVFAWYKHEADADFAELARKSFDVMVQHRITPEYGLGGAKGWCIRTETCSHLGPFGDPFSAVMAWKEWFVSRSGG
jgi:hypothetical protein